MLNIYLPFSSRSLICVDCCFFGYLGSSFAAFFSSSLLGGCVSELLMHSFLFLLTCICSFVVMITASTYFFRRSWIDSDIGRPLHCSNSVVRFRNELCAFITCDLQFESSSGEKGRCTDLISCIYLRPPVISLLLGLSNRLVSSLRLFDRQPKRCAP